MERVVVTLSMISLVHELRNVKSEPLCKQHSFQDVQFKHIHVNFRLYVPTSSNEGDIHRRDTLRSDDVAHFQLRNTVPLRSHVPLMV